MTLMVSHIKVLARTAEEHADKQRAALGKCVWRLDTGEDSLEDKHVGPSAYAKAQGTPIKIWGFFCDGHLEYYVLPKDYTARYSFHTAHEREPLQDHGRQAFCEVVPKVHSSW